MDECPHCGEPLAGDAESCPHCGSDFETGWKPDTDYYSVELPEDEPAFSQDHAPAAPGIGWESFLWSLVVAASILVFFWAGTAAEPSRHVLVAFALLLLVSLVVFHRWVSAAR
jgi:hypothetical protein